MKTTACSPGVIAPQPSTTNTLRLLSMLAFVLAFCPSLKADPPALATVSDDSEGKPEISRSPDTAELDKAIDQELDRIDREENQVRYRGQYRALIPLGMPAAQRLLQRFLDESQPFNRRQSCANALMDVATADLIPEIEAQLSTDLLIEVWAEKELVLLLAKLGQRLRIDRWLQELELQASQAPNTATLPSILEALTLLGDLRFRSGLVQKACMAHQQRIDLLGDIAGRVRVELRPGLIDEQLAIHYNLACCFSLLGETQKAMSALETSLGATSIRLEMVLVDGDLKPLRQLPNWADWVKKMSSAPTKEPDQEDQR